jgi:integrase
MPVKQLPSGAWDIAVCVNRRRVHRVLAAGTSARDAKRFEHELIASLARKSLDIPGDPGLTDLMAAYMRHADTLKAPKPAKYHAARIGRWVAGYRASQARQCAAAIVQDMTGAYKPATINKSLGTLKKALRLAYDRGTIPTNYGDSIRLLPENNVRTSALTLAQVQALADCASENVRAAIWISVYTGCRRGEIIGIRADDIGPDSIILRSGMTKTAKHRAIPIIPPLRPWLKYLPLKIGRGGVEGGFRDARIKAKLPQFTFHDLRRSCAVLMLQAGVPMHVIAKLLGHSSTRVTEARYAHVQLDAVRAGLEAAFPQPLTQDASKSLSDAA